MKKQFVFIGSLIILIISIFTFVVFGFGTEVFSSISSSKNTLDFGKYDNRAITNKPGSEFDTNVTQIANMLGNNTQNPSFIYYVYDGAFKTTINHMALKNAVTKSGYVVPESAVNRELLPLYTIDGSFNKKLFNQTDDQVVADQKRKISEALIYNRFNVDVFGETQPFYDFGIIKNYIQGYSTEGDKLELGSHSLYGLKDNSIEAEFIADMSQENRSFEVATFNKNDYPTSEAVAFGRENAELFMSYDLSAVTVTTEKEAKEILKQLKSGELTFDTAVLEKSQKFYTDTDGKLRNNLRFQIADILEDDNDISNIVALADGEYSSVIKTTQYGSTTYSIFTKNGEGKTPDFTDEVVLEAIKSYIKENEAGRIEDYFMAQAKDLAEKTSSSLKVASKGSSLVTVTNVENVPLNCANNTLLNKTIPSELSSIASDVNLLEKAFSLKVGQISEPLVTSSSVIVLRCTASTKADKGNSDSIAKSIRRNDINEYQENLISDENHVVNNFDAVFAKAFANQ